MKLVALAALCGGCLLTPAPPTCDGPYVAPQKLYELSSTDIEDAPWLSRDRLEILFASQRGTMPRVWRATRSAPDAIFDPPTPVTDGLHFEQNPFVTSDGNTLYYTEFGGESGVYKMTRTGRDAPFENPVPVPDLIYSGALSLTDDQLDVYYDPSSGMQYIETAHRSSITEPFPPSHPLDLGPGEYAAPSITGDGTLLLVSRLTDLGNNQHLRTLARSERRADGTFGPAVDVAGLEANSYDGSSLDDGIIVYACCTGDTDLYFVERSCHQ